MIRFFFLLWACFLIAPISANAQVKPQWSAEKLKGFYEEAQTLKRGCQANPSMYNAYDCDCLAAHSYDARVQGDTASNQSNLLDKILPKCGNAAQLSTQKYQQCLQSQSARRRDYEVYCQCFAGEFAKYYEKVPSSKGSVRIKMMTEAHRTCGKRYPLPSADNRRELKQELKQRNLFERLFPGLTDN
ncbi:MAG: hypothetical protein AB7E85_07845 [Pseudobdellovibrionaceae bacterium]